MAGHDIISCGDEAHRVGVGPCWSDGVRQLAIGAEAAGAAARHLGPGTAGRVPGGRLALWRLVGAPRAGRDVDRRRARRRDPARLPRRHAVVSARTDAIRGGAPQDGHRRRRTPGGVLHSSRALARLPRDRSRRLRPHLRLPTGSRIARAHHHRRRWRSLRAHRPLPGVWSPRGPGRPARGQAVLDRLARRTDPDRAHLGVAVLPRRPGRRDDRRRRSAGRGRRRARRDPGPCAPVGSSGAHPRHLCHRGPEPARAAVAGGGPVGRRGPQPLRLVPANARADDSQLRR